MVGSAAAVRVVEAGWGTTAGLACSRAGLAQAPCLEDRAAGWAPNPLHTAATRIARSAAGRLNIRVPGEQKRSKSPAERSTATSARRDQKVDDALTMSPRARRAERMAALASSDGSWTSRQSPCAPCAGFPRPSAAWRGWRRLVTRAAWASRRVRAYSRAATSPLARHRARPWPHGGMRRPAEILLSKTSLLSGYSRYRLAWPWTDDRDVVGLVGGGRGRCHMHARQEIAAHVPSSLRRFLGQARDKLCSARRLSLDPLAQPWQQLQRVARAPPLAARAPAGAAPRRPLASAAARARCRRRSSYLKSTLRSPRAACARPAQPSTPRAGTATAPPHDGCASFGKCQ